MRVQKNSKKYIKIKDLLHSRGGVTMVELVITIVLLGIFAAGTCQILASAIRTYHDMRSLQESQQVSDTLMDKITGEIEGAQASFTELNTSQRQNGTLELWNNGTLIKLRDRTGSQINITVKDKFLCIHYYETKTGNGENDVTIKAVDWKFDPKAYMGFKIKELKFEFPGLESGSVYPKNLVIVTLKLENNTGNVYSSKRYVECYNFKKEQSDFDKIIDHGNANLNDY